MHLLRERKFYSEKNAGSRPLLPDEWMQNRIRCLSALQGLNLVAVGIAQSAEFRRRCRWMPDTSKQRHQSDGKNTPYVLPPLDRNRVYAAGRARLGGIFRAQPHSHLFEQSKYHDCTLAPWADLVMPEQMAEYLRLRDYRADEMPDIPANLKNPTRQQHESTQRQQPHNANQSQMPGSSLSTAIEPWQADHSIDSGNEYDWEDAYFAEPVLDQFGNDVSNDFAGNYTDVSATETCTCEVAAVPNSPVAALVAHPDLQGVDRGETSELLGILQDNIYTELGLNYGNIVTNNDYSGSTAFGSGYGLTGSWINGDYNSNSHGSYGGYDGSSSGHGGDYGGYGGGYGGGYSGGYSGGDGGGYGGGSGGGYSGGDGGGYSGGDSGGY
jgi:hypothetical protein